MKKQNNILLIALLASGIVMMNSCKDDTTTEPETKTTDLPNVYKKIYGASDVYLEGDFVVVQSNGLPDHKSPYYQNTQWSDKYEAYNGSNGNWNQNPNTISSGNMTYKIPLNPKEASNHSATPLGPIGVSLNGVAFYNQYAGPNNTPLTNEINSFDQYNGHPQQQGSYHYHVEPLYLTSENGRDALLGFLLDGFPVYGPIEDGNAVSNADLDAYHGHSHATTDFPDGVYHYHITDADPYLNGSGYFGTPGTITQ